MRLCPRCQRANPEEAAYCHFDGLDLRAPQSDAVAVKSDSHLPHDFVFPSGRRCKSYDDLVQGCQEEWGTASELLREGAFRQFFTGAGRLDLAKASEDARAQPDGDVALETFLSRLPATEVPKPRLELEPRRILLGQMRLGSTGNARLLVINQGRGLLTGTVAVTEGGDWLKLTGANASATLVIKTVREQSLRLEIDARNLLAPQRYAGRLTVITNGGIVEVSVRLDCIAHPFPKAPFNGAASPRDMAVRMRSNPKAASPMLESGDVARWFEANRWGYPVQGPTAQGMAAVQQFFECMGLAKPPRVELSESYLQFTCLYPEVLQGQLVLQSPDRKYVYGQADSDAIWLKIATPVVSGAQQAAIGFTIDSSLLDPNRLVEGSINVRGNGGQSLAARVRVDVRRPAEPPTHRLFRPVLTGILAGVLLRGILALPADVYARVVGAGPGLDTVAGSFASWAEAPAGAAFVKPFVLATWWVGALLGAVMLGRRGGHWADVPCGLVAGSATGVAVAGTIACLFPMLDIPARLLWRALGSALGASTSSMSVATATLLWIGVAVATWGGLGAFAAMVLAHSGGAAVRLLERVGAPVAWVLRCCGLKRLAGFVG